MGLVADGGEPIKVTGGARLRQPVPDARRHAPRSAARSSRATRLPGQPRVAVLSDALWRSRFNADPSIIGRGIQLDQEPHTIVGVMPAGFEVFGPGTDLWAPLPWVPGNAQFKATFSQGVAPAGAGVTAEAATRELTELAPAMRKDLATRRTTGARRCACSRCRRRSPATSVRRC